MLFRSEILDLNPKAEKLFGKSRESCINQNFIQNFVHVNDQKNAERTFKILFNNGAKERFKTNLIDANGKFTMMDCILTLSNNKQSTAESMILSIKK